MAEPAVTALAYAAPPSRWRRRRLRLFLLALLLLLTVAGLWRWRGPWAREQAKLLYWQRQCLKYSPPDGQVVWEPDPAAAAKLLADPPHYFRPNLDAPSKVKAAYKPPAAWASFATRVESDGLGLDAKEVPLLYLHERRTRSGLRRLVVVHHFPELAHVGPAPFLFSCSVVEPASLTGTPRVLSHSGHHGGPVLDPVRGPLPATRYFAGRSDPADAARFTLRYETDGRRGTIEGRLLEDGRSVAFTFLDGPAAEPSAWPRGTNVTPMQELERLDY